MVFNNGQYLYQRTPQSSILEINPYLDANGRDTGQYVNPPVAGYRRETYDKDTHNQPRLISKQVVWSYRSVNGTDSSVTSGPAHSVSPMATRSSVPIRKAISSK